MNEAENMRCLVKAKGGDDRLKSKVSLIQNFLKMMLIIITKYRDLCNNAFIESMKADSASVYVLYFTHSYTIVSPSYYECMTNILFLCIRYSLAYFTSHPLGLRVRSLQPCRD